MKRVLFVCLENSCRSQMAEAFARRLGGERLEAYSAGSRPSGRVSPRAIEAMWEVGYDLSAHRSKALSEIPDETYDAVVSMGCGEACPYVPTRLREDWQVPDPKDMDPESFAGVRDRIRAQVEGLLSRLFPAEALPGR